MAIMNANEDSFFEQSRMLGNSSSFWVDTAQAFVSQGADCIDLGAESSRPGAHYIDLDEELDRLIPVLKAVRPSVNVPISIDTRKAEVARRCLDEGADIINDISALRDDPDMARVAADFSCPVILMHMQGNPLSMQKAPLYEDCVADVSAWLLGRAKWAESQGITSVILDPGIGFGKTGEDNLMLLSKLDLLLGLGYPVLVGASRKGFIGRCLGSEVDGAILPRPVEGRLAGSLGVAAWASVQGASLVRVHDVKETTDVLRVIACIKAGEFNV